MTTDERNGGKTHTMAENDKRKGGKMRMQYGKMTNVMWGKSMNAVPGNDKRNDGKITNAIEGK